VLVDEWESICARLDDAQTAKVLEVFCKAFIFLEQRGAKELVFSHEKGISVDVATS
jgi:hypothetical protein